MLAKKDSLNLFSDACTVLRSEDYMWSVDRKFLDKKSTEVSVAVAFNGYCFIYERETMKCITMFRLRRILDKRKRITRLIKENINIILIIVNMMMKTDVNEYAPIGGTVFFIHNVPLTYADTAVIKILGDE